MQDITERMLSRRGSVCDDIYAVFPETLDIDTVEALEINGVRFDLEYGEVQELQMDYSGGEYVKKAHFSSVNMVSGGIFGENEGVLLSEDCELSMLKAIALSFETFEGDKWENPYFNQFCGFFEGKPYIEADCRVSSNWHPAKEYIYSCKLCSCRWKLLRFSQSFYPAGAAYR